MIVLGLGVLVVAGVWAASMSTTDPLAGYAAVQTAARPAATTAPPEQVEGVAAPPAGASRVAPAVDPAWVRTIAAKTGIPDRALEAYANATLRLADEQPGCRLSWPTLAGVGAIESRHGTIGGTAFGPDGRSERPIVGVPLNGGGVAQIADTDGGTLYGDAKWDLAVGPMQFIPSSWSRWAADADGDGQSDPHSVDDSTLAAARYLCAAGGDLTRGDAWHRAILSYNHSVDYVDAVRSHADAFARASRG